MNNVGTGTNLAKRKRKKKISIGVATRQRPEMLKRCLESLTAQVVPDGAALVIIVVENDREEFSRGVVATVEKQSAIPLEYHIERHIGISAARNALLDAAMANGSDYLAFIDDDELAYPEWINRLFAATTEHGAIIVGGPVGRTFESKDVPSWAKLYFKQSRQASWPNVIVGDLPSGTGNILVDLELVRERGIRFDMKYNLSGSEDKHFVRALVEACDKRPVFVNDAIVCEVVPASRLNRSYIFRLTLRIQINKIICFKRGQFQGVGFVVSNACSGVCNIVFGGFFCILFYIFSEHLSTIFLMRVATGCGTLLGLIGYRYAMYNNVTGH